MMYSKSNRETIALRTPVKWDEFTAYFLGYFLGDGCITKRGQLYLVSKDLEIIEHLNKELSNGVCKVHSRKPAKGSKQYRLIFTSKIWKDFFVSCGLTPSKSTKELQIKFPVDANLFHFLRGLLDSDGSVSCGVRSQIDICGGSYIEQIQSILGIGRVYKRSSIYVWKVNTKNDMKELFNLLYSNSSVRMSRKFEVYKFIVSKLSAALDELNSL